MLKILRGFDEDFGDHSEYSFTFNSGDDMSDNFGSGIQDFESEENADMTKSLQRVTIRSLYYIRGLNCLHIHNPPESMMLQFRLLQS